LANFALVAFTFYHFHLITIFPLAEDWSNIEVELIITDYLSMLNDELIGKPINKSEHRKNISKLLNKRSEGSIEFKHQNISAVLIKLGLPFIKGYKPLWNYQRILEEKAIQLLSVQKGKLEPAFISFSETATAPVLNTFDFGSIIDAPPEHHLLQEPEIKYGRKPIKINYLEREQTNSSLGSKGEEFVIGYEKWRLVKENKSSLADKIEWVSKNDDGAGFDILSKNIDGSDRYIEVKTTKLSKDTPIFFSKNEYEFSKEQSEKYHLYRVFNFSEKPKMFYLKGHFDSFCQKIPVNYKGYF
jgi:hypothetical protein